MGRSGLGKMVLFGRYTFLEKMGLVHGRCTQGGFGYHSVSEITI